MVNVNFNKFVPYLLGLVVLLLVVLVPGGPVETRSFSHLSTLVFWGFNVFLTSLGLATLAMIYFTIKEKNWAYITCIVLGFLYLLVYVLDMAKVFPESPDAMSTPLFIVEVIDTIAAIFLMISSFKALKQE